MVKRLTNIGNSLGLIIERPILDLLGIDQETDLEITTDGKGLFVEPVKLAKKERALRSGKRMMKTHAETLKKLAE